MEKEKDNKTQDAQEQKPKDGSVLELEYKPSESEQEWINFDRKKIVEFANQREYPYLQFDNMAYSRQYYENEKVGLNFLSPKKNKSETPFNSGITANKIRTIGSMINGYNFEPMFTVKYKGEILDDLSTIFTEWVRDSRTKEKYTEKMRIQNRTLLEQGTAYTIEHMVNQTYYDKKILSPYSDLSKLDKVKYAKAVKKTFSMPQCDHVRGTKVFLSNMKESDIDKQGLVYIVEFEQYDQLKSIFGNMENFKYVRKGKAAPTMMEGMYIQNPYHIENYVSTVNENEVVTVIDERTNRFQIYIARVPMFPEDFPLTVVSPSGKINIAKGDLNPSQDFAISRGIPFDTKIDQQMYDLTVKIMFIKMKQSAYVPSVNNTGKYLSPAIYEPGMMSEGFKSQEIEKLIDQPGITQPDFSWAKLMHESIDSKSLMSILEGQAVDAKTLGEYLERMKKAAVTIGYIFDSISAWESQKSLLRLYNLIAYGVSKSADNDKKYQDIFIGGNDEQWRVSFNDTQAMTPDDMYRLDIEMEKRGKDVKHANISIRELRKVVNDPEFVIEVDVVPVDKDNDAIAQTKYISKLTTAQSIFGPESIAADRAKKQFARKFNDKYSDIFKTPEELELELLQAQQQMAEQAAQSAMAGNGPAAPAPKPQPQEKKQAASPLVDGFYR